MGLYWGESVMGDIVYTWHGGGKHVSYCTTMKGTLKHSISLAHDRLVPKVSSTPDRICCTR